MPNTLFLRLEGPLQSWGERARWDVRDTAPEPTKSGIVGLLGCALGIKEDDKLASISRKIRVGIRCDRPGTFSIDYQTVTGGVLSAEGKIKLNASTHTPETVVSSRVYLSDASFLAAIQAEPEDIQEFSHAVRDPVWPVFLGRKSCPPTCFIYEGEGDFTSLEQALKEWRISDNRISGFSKNESGSAMIRAVIECGPDEGVMRRDEILSNRYRTFLPRYTRDVAIEIIPGNEVV